MGRILNIDLSGGTISEESLQEKLLRDFVGGAGRRLTIVSGFRVRNDDLYSIKHTGIVC